MSLPWTWERNIFDNFDIDMFIQYGWILLLGLLLFGIVAFIIYPILQIHFEQKKWR